MKVKRVLMVAYHFPPLAGSSGIQRTLRFAQQLRDFGWEPVVLTAHPRAYERVSPDLLPELPEGMVVERAFALDTARHLALLGRYPGFLALPDRWLSWHFGAVRAGLRLARELEPRVLWSTYPIATAHAIGATLARRTGLPWIADFRDPMAQDGYPPDLRVWRSYKRIEEEVFRRARFSVFTAPGAMKMYARRYPEAEDRMRVIENGYDEESFEVGPGRSAGPLVPGATTLLHSGVMYPWERDPSRFFEALRHLGDEGVLDAARMRVRFRAPVHDSQVLDLARRHGVADLIEVMPPLPYREALAEMQRADGLLIFQAANCNEQIPAKFYEYLRTGRPVLALTDPEGDTAKAMKAAGLDTVAPLDDAAGIAALLSRFVQQAPAGDLPLAHDDYVARASRRGRTRELADLLDEVQGVISEGPRSEATRDPLGD